jgi:hypothetical protein
VLLVREVSRGLIVGQQHRHVGVREIGEHERVNGAFRLGGARIDTKHRSLLSSH